MPNKVSVLGTTYTIEKKKYDEEEAFARRNIDGYCDGMARKIVYCDMDTYKGWENEEEETKRANERQTLRHEIVHAFFNESGLMASSAQPDCGWSQFEEMIDWWAIQGQKVYRAWQEVGCIDPKK